MNILTTENPTKQQQQHSLILREHRTGQRERRRLAHQLQRALHLRIRVHVDGDHRPEDLLGHQAIVRIGDAHNGRLHEVAARRVRRATGDDLRAGGAMGVRQIAGDALVGALIDDGRRERVEVLDVADLQVGVQRDELLAQLRPEGGGHVGSGAGRALLAAELEGGTDGGRCDAGHVRRRMDEVEVLAAAFADQAREVAVDGDVLADLLPEALEGAVG